jgi:phage terminase large subunit GpA-like protein
MEPGPGYCHFPSLFDELGNPVYNEAYFKQLVSEKPVIKYSRGVAHRVWQKIKPSLRNEALDCRVYACAALAILNPNLPKLAAILANSPAEKSTPARAVQSPPRGQSFMPRRPKGGGFVNGWK